MMSDRAFLRMLDRFLVIYIMNDHVDMKVVEFAGTIRDKIQDALATEPEMARLRRWLLEQFDVYADNPGQLAAYENVVFQIDEEFDCKLED
jgi:hypothetical protein